VADYTNGFPSSRWSFSMTQGPGSSASGDNSPASANASLSDQSLMRRLGAGSESAAETVYGRYAQRLLALARSKCSSQLARCVEPEDIVQSVFRTFFRRAKEGEFAVPEGEELWGLLLVITLNKIRAEADFHFAAKRDVRARRNLDEVPTPQATDTPADDALARLLLDDALRQLPESRRELIRLRMEGHEVAEIARMTQRPLRTVERVLHNFRESLRGALTEEH
jgi:RNA polymerase sigma-70 factor (ECF subfamily)